MNDNTNMAHRYEREIPEGYEARIEGNKVIFERKDSEDERIRRTLLELVSNDKACGYTDFYVRKGIDCDDAIAYLEKQKDASKAIEAVDRIDKYIDEHLANAHDMKDSNPDKKYYRGWDDALGNMSGILQDVYSEGKQKEHHENINKDNDRVEKSPDHDKVKNAYAQGRHHGIQWVLNNPGDYELQKVTEWSEEDKDKLKKILATIQLMGCRVNNNATNQSLIDWLKSLRPQPHWKPSEEQMCYLLAVINEPNNAGSESCHIILKSLYRDLKKLK